MKCINIDYIKKEQIKNCLDIFLKNFEALHIKNKKMGKLESFSINLDKPNGVYNPGETLTGSLLVRASERFKINSIKIKLYGAANNYW